MAHFVYQKQLKRGNFEFVLKLLLVSLILMAFSPSSGKAQTSDVEPQIVIAVAENQCYVSGEFQLFFCGCTGR